MKRLFVLTLALLALAISATLATAALPTTGPRVSMISSACTNQVGDPYFPESRCPTRFVAANTPFHILHYYISLGEDTAALVQTGEFRLYQDGVSVKGLVWQQFDATSKRPIARGNLYNYAAGLPVGTYLFHWEFWLGGTLRWQSNTPVVSG
jgi:hypothetical protein